MFDVIMGQAVAYFGLSDDKKPPIGGGFEIDLLLRKLSW